MNIQQSCPWAPGVQLERQGGGGGHVVQEESPQEEALGLQGRVVHSASCGSEGSGELLGSDFWFGL